MPVCVCVCVCRRVVFTSLEKFDGYQQRRLLPSEVKQIAGRAGRFGSKYGGGVVTCLDPVKHLHSPFPHHSFVTCQAIIQVSRPVASWITFSSQAAALDTPERTAAAFCCAEASSSPHVLQQGLSLGALYTLQLSWCAWQSH